MFPHEYCALTRRRGFTLRLLLALQYSCEMRKESRAIMAVLVSLLPISLPRLVLVVKHNDIFPLTLLLLRDDLLNSEVLGFQPSMSPPFACHV